ncbi:MAG: DUF885 domain-containing protein [Methanobacteriota archaeon]|nr:MAG: DUF885 domain-containing protein [Euryarchaeota archaeon]
MKPSKLLLKTIGIDLPNIGIDQFVSKAFQQITSPLLNFKFGKIPTELMNGQTKFENLMHEFLRGYAVFFPSSVFSAGWREYAGIVPDFSMERLDATRLFLRNMKARAEEIDENELDDVAKIDLWVMLNHIDSLLFSYDVLESHKTNPMTYAGPAFIFDYLLKQYAPLEQRIQELAAYLGQLPKVYEDARKNLDFSKIAKEHVTMTLSMLKGMVDFFDNIADEIKTLIPDQGSVKEQTLDLVQKKAQVAKEALNDYVAFLEKGDPKGTFRMGKENFQQMLWANERVATPVEKILDAGMKNLERNLTELLEAAKRIDPAKTPQEILEKIKSNHPTKENLISETQQMLEGIRDFLIETEFVSVPSMVMPKVIPTPKPFRDWAFAAMDTPGALETKATDSYYYITPPDNSWSPEEQESWLTVFNYKQLLDICVHEAYPGHYLHHLHNQRSKSLMAKLFGAYHFWEGYALYVEEAMWEHGFQKGDDEYRIAQLIETLIRNVRLICAIKYHTTDTFTVEDGTKLFMEKAFMEKKPAESEAFRGTYDPGYLNYALGKLMIEKLREDYMVEHPDDFSFKKFHDDLLSFGAPPIPLLRKVLLKNDDGNVL